MQKQWVVAAVLALVGFTRMASALPVKIEKADAILYEQVPAFVQNGERGVVMRTLKAPEGKMFLFVSAQVNIAWDANTQSVKFKSAGLFDGNEEMKPAGNIEEIGIYSDFDFGVELRRPWDWKAGQPDKPIAFTHLYVIPKDKKQLTLKFDDATAVVTVPDKPSVVDFAALAEVKIESAKLSDSVETQFNNGQTSTLTNPGGKILELAISLQPKTNNMPNNPNSFSWMPDWFALDLGNGLRIGTLGSKFMSGIADAPFNPNRFDAAQPWPTDHTTLYFAVPADLKDFTLTMLMAPMAKGSAK